MTNHKLPQHTKPECKNLKRVGRAAGRLNAELLFPLLLLLLLLLSYAARAEVLVEDGFAGTAGAPPDAVKFEWSGQLALNGSGQLVLSTDAVDQSWLCSKAGAALGAGDLLVLQMRAYAYGEAHWSPGVYGDQQPRGLRVGSDANNVVEFYSASRTSLGLRVRKDGLESAAFYAFPAGVDVMHDYEISVTATLAVFRVDGALAGTFTNNIPTGALNVHVSTWDGGGGVGNVPVSLDSLSLTLTNDLVPPLDFTFTTNAGAITITGYTGPGGSVVIPDTINGLPVTSIVGPPFGPGGPYWANVTNVTIPASVTSIGEFAFYYSPSLVSITIPDSVTNIEGWAFENCYGLTSVTIPNRVTNIGGAAFWNCPFLANVTIGNSVTRIGSAAFAKCVSLASVVIPDSTIHIEDQAFSESGLTNVVIGNSVSFIGNEAFSCFNLAGVYFRGNAPIVGGQVFFNANSATVYRLPEATGWPPVPDMWAGRPTALWGTPYRLTVNSGSGSGSYPYGALVTVVAGNAPEGQIFDRWTGATQYVAGVRSATTLVTMPAQDISLTAIYRANYFTLMTNAGAITITGYTGPGGAEVLPDTINGLPVTEIGQNAFNAKINLTSITIPDSVTNMGPWAFLGSVGLTRVEIGLGLRAIAYQAFSGCDNLAAFAVNPLNPSLSSLDGVLFNRDQTMLILCPEGRTGHYTTPGTVTNIAVAAFAGCDKLAGITIPDSVTTIQGQAFYGCGSLSDVSIPDSVTGTLYQTFQSCFRLTSVHIGSGVASLDGTFIDCSSLAGVTIGNGVTNITGAFIRCSRLQSVLVPLSVTTLGEMAFAGCSALTNVAMPGSVTVIGDSAFSACAGLRSLAIPNTVTSIGNFAFHYCTGLASITLPNRAASIGYAAFQECSSLACVRIPDGVTYIGGGIFANCTSLTNVTIPNSVTTIGYKPFLFCTSLVSLTIPGSVTGIEDRTFEGCSNLARVFFQGNAPLLGSYVFTGADNATAYYLPGTTNWSSTYGNRPAVLWNPQVQTGAAGFGVQTDGFGFEITGTAGIPIVVEACTNLAGGLWVPLQSGTLTNGSFSFSDPQWIAHPGRFYRIRSP